MDAESIKSSVLAFMQHHQLLAEPIVFALGFAEGIPVLSLFAPSSMLFLAIGSAQGASGGSLWTLWLSGAAGAVLGDCVTYAIGRYFKDQAKYIWPFSRHPERMAQGHALFERWGAGVVLGGKFLGFLRPIVPVIAGILEMPVLLFLIASVASSLLWAGAFLAPGWGLGSLFD
ncbi:MAG TPA: DedA family protein [Hyphomicrobiaceae bacterium]|jgi:membrane protein DedA with SNARE-associated domain|nr:DedA family protein [Hyphomicrobiaceae bacterium]